MPDVPPPPIPPPPPVPDPMGELAQAIDDGVASRIAGKEPEAARPVYSSQDHDAGSYVRNPDCWLAGVDLTGVSPWNSAGGTQRAGTVISPRHVLHAAHFPLGVGTTVRFVTAGNLVVEREVTAQTQAGSTDALIATLGEALPATIAPVPLMPPGLHAKYRRPSEGRVRVAVIDQQERALVAWVVQSSLTVSLGWTGRLDEWGSVLVSGDSGSPVLAILGGEAVLWGHAHGAGLGPSVATHADAIRAIVQAGGEDVTFADLSEYPDLY